MIADADGRVIVATFASLISRVQMVLDSAERHDRRVFVTGRSMVNNVRMARELGYLEAGDNVLMNPREMRDHPDRRTIVISTGAQGEPTAALTRMANGTHQHVTIQQGDTVVLSSSPIPGNETLVYRNIDNLFRAARRSSTTASPPSTCAATPPARSSRSSTASSGRSTSSASTASTVTSCCTASSRSSSGAHPDDAFVLSDGDVLEVTADEASVVDRIPADYVYVDGLGVGDIDRIVLRDRQHLASDGMVVVVAAIDRQRGQLSGVPEVMSPGFVVPTTRPR